MPECGWTASANAKPVVHNDYESLLHKKGLPEGHAPVVRELVVPVLRGEKIVAVLGVGNKRRKYDVHDVRAIQQLADLAWETVTHKQAEEKIRKLNETLEQRIAKRTAELENRTELLQRLALELFGAQDRERRHIAAILHDDFQQQLAYIKSVAPFHQSVRNIRIAAPCGRCRSGPFLL